MRKLINYGFFAFTVIMAARADAAIVFATQANIAKVWATAGSGDIIKLSGTFTGVALQNKTSKKAITIDATAATFTGTLKFQNVNGVKVIGGKFDSTGGKTSYNKAIVVYGGSNISFDHTDVISNASDGAQGISLLNVTNAKVTNSTFTNVGAGIGVEGSHYVTLSGNSVMGSSRDGFDVFDSHNVMVNNNSCSGGNPAPDAHPDCVQLSSIAGHPVQSDIKVIDNIAVGDTQGFTSFSEYKGGGLRITMSGNIINGLMPQGIACYGCVDSIFTDNFLSAQPGAAHYVNMNIIDGMNNYIAGNVYTEPGQWSVLPSNYNSAYYQLTGKIYQSQSAMDFAAFASLSGAVPEPAAWTMMITGFIAVGLVRRRRVERIVAA